MVYLVSEIFFRDYTETVTQLTAVLGALNLVLFNVGHWIFSFQYFFSALEI